MQHCHLPMVTHYRLPMATRFSSLPLVNYTYHPITMDKNDHNLWSIKPDKNLKLRQLKIIFKPSCFTQMTFILGNSSIFAEIKQLLLLHCIRNKIMGFHNDAAEMVHSQFSAVWLAQTWCLPNSEWYKISLGPFMKKNQNVRGYHYELRLSLKLWRRVNCFSEQKSHKY